MKKTFVAASLVAATLLSGLAVAPALAQPGSHTPGIDQSQRALTARIAQGLQSGHITPSEAQLLQRRERDIRHSEAAYRADGRVTPRERQQLRADLARLGDDVERAMANRQTVLRRGGGVEGMDGIDSRAFEIRQRIDEGVRTHRLSLREAGALQARSDAIERREAAYRADGMLTVQERRVLRDELTALRGEVDRLVNPRG
jgi:hypothetical protein